MLDLLLFLLLLLLLLFLLLFLLLLLLLLQVLTPYKGATEDATALVLTRPCDIFILLRPGDHLLLLLLSFL